MTKPDTSEAQYLVEKLAGRLERKIEWVDLGEEWVLTSTSVETPEEWVTRIKSESEE